MRQLTGLRAALAAVAVLLPVLLSAAPAQAVVATFSMKFEDKLFIAPIPVGRCLAFPVVGADAARTAAYFTFCQATSAVTSENPPTGALVAPLDARILGGEDVTWRCDTQALPAPIGPTLVAPIPTAAGPEPPIFVGTVNPMAVRDQIAANGTWGGVTSGRPHVVPEAAFQALRIRLTRDIWNKLTGAITCGVDARGMPTSNVNLTLLSTNFPSHRVWYRTPVAAPAPGAVIFNVPQGFFFWLWFLPLIAAP